MHHPSYRQKSSWIILQHSKPSWRSNPARQRQSADLRRNRHLPDNKDTLIDATNSQCLHNQSMMTNAQLHQRPLQIRFFKTASELSHLMSC
jgi:hypothetical protein